MIEFKDYLRILKRRWPIAILCAGLVFALMTYTATGHQRQYSVSWTILFKPAAWELGYAPPEELGLSMAPAESRPYLMQSDKTMQRASQLLRDRTKGEVSITKEQFRSKTSISRGPVNNSYELTARDLNRERAKLIIQAAFDAYTEQTKEDSNKAVVKTEQTIRDRLDQLNEEIRRLQARHEDMIEDRFREHGIPDPDVHATIRSNLLLELERSRQENQIELRKSHERLNQIPRIEHELALRQMVAIHAPNSVPPIAESDDLHLVQNLKNQYRQLEDLRRKYRENHPQIVRIKDEIESVRKAIATEIPESRLHRAEVLKRQAELLQGVDELLQNILNEEYRSLRTFNQNRQDLILLRDKIKELRSRAGKDQEKLDTMEELKTKVEQVVEGSAEIINQKEPVQDAPASPNRIYLLGVLSLVVGIAVAFLMEYISDRIRNAQDVRTYMMLPTIATIRKLSPREHNLLSAALKSPVHEEYNKLATFMETLCSEHRARSILFTSALMEEGKSTVAANLAVALARGGAEVILVDTDMRRSTIHNTFGVSNQYGLSELLTAAAGAEQDIGSVLDQALQPTQEPGLRVLTAGASPPNPVALLKSEAMSVVHDELKRRARFVIFDSPPVLTVVDAPVLAASADLTLMVVAEGMVRRPEARQARHTLNQVDANLAGAILNKVSVDPESYYYYYYHYYSRRPNGGGR